MLHLIICIFLIGAASGERPKRGLVPVGYGEPPVYHQRMYPLPRDTMVQGPVYQRELDLQRTSIPVREVTEQLPLVPRFYPRPLFHNVGSRVDSTNNYFGDGRDVSDLYTNGMSRVAVKDVQQMGNQGMQGHSGTYHNLNDNEGSQDIINDTHGKRYNQGAGGYSAGQKFRDTLAKGGYGGSGAVGHNKGHRTTGFHKSYQNIESGKDTTFVDEDHDNNEQKFGEEFDNTFYDNSNGGYEGQNDNGAFGESLQQDIRHRGGTNLKGSQSMNWDNQSQNGHYNDQDLARVNSVANINRKSNFDLRNSGLSAGNNGEHYYMPY